jgi:acetyltransferase-like isoleucine patch superfamily enzyme
MRENIIQAGNKGTDGRLYIDGDWFNGGLPATVTVAETACIDTSYGFDAFRSQQNDGLFIDEASGCYDTSSFVVSEKGRVTVGKFTIINGSTIVCKCNITIGNHCMLSWGSVLTDTWVTESMPLETRRAMLYAAAESQQTSYPFFGDALPVVLEDNCWVGFGAVIMPGVRLGKGCIVGCKTIVYKDVPPYAIVAGINSKVIRYLNPDDTEESKRDAFAYCLNRCI